MDFEFDMQRKAISLIAKNNCLDLINPIPHGGGGGIKDSALLQIVFFITSVRDAAEPQIW